MAVVGVFYWNPERERDGNWIERKWVSHSAIFVGIRSFTNKTPREQVGGWVTNTWREFMVNNAGNRK